MLRIQTTETFKQRIVVNGASNDQALMIAVSYHGVAACFNRGRALNSLGLIDGNTNISSSVDIMRYKTQNVSDSVEVETLKLQIELAKLQLQLEIMKK